MHRMLAVTVAVAALAVVMLLASAAVGAPSNFVAPMSGDQEVPAVDTNATGVAKFQLNHDGTGLDYRLNVANIENVTMAHIHMAPRGRNGPVVAWLYPSGPPPQLIEGRTDGTLATGTLTSEDLVGPMAGAEIEDLVELIRQGRAYVNVHTQQYPGGEVRGQIDVPRGEPAS